MLCAYLVTTVGVPVRARITKSGGVPFPCQHHACGCLTAEQCRENCCCYSAAERMAWAHEHGIDPPAAWMAEMAADADRPAAPSACCAHRAEQPECAGEHADHRHESAACHGHDAPIDDTRVILSFSARTCRAITSLWCATGAVIVPPTISWQFQWTVVEWVSPLGDSLGSRDLAPPVPPPRV